MRGVAAAGVIILGLAARADAQRVEFDRPAYRLTSIGQRLQVTVRVTDASGRPVSNAATVFRVADPSVASVSPRGEVVSRKSGLTRVWAIAGRDSGSTFVTVDPRAAKFTFSPPVLLIDALKEPVQLTVQISDSAGVPISGASAVANCRSLNDQVASLTSAGVRPRANGVTYIRCTDRGFADSLRVEVRQRAVKTQLSSRALSKIIGDTFTVRLKAYDRSGDSVVNARPTWVSMDPKSVTVDPTTGRALARGAPGTRLIAQLGDVSDTVSVNVSTPSGGGLLQAPIAVVDTTTSNSPARRFSLRANALRMYEGDTKPFMYSITDTLGLTVQGARVTIRSADTSVAAPTDSGTMRAGRVGQVYAYVRYQGLIDSAIVTVVDSSQRKEEESRNAGDAGPTTVDPPSYAPGLVEKYREERAALMDSIHRSGAFAPPSGKIITASLYAGLAAHSSNQVNSATSQLIEDRSGVVYGGRATVKPFGWLALSGDVHGGQLSTKGTIGEDLTITEGVGDLSFFLTPWLGLGGGYAVRYEKTKIAGQTWKIPHASITARSTFVGDLISTTATLSVLPGASFSGMPEDQQPEIGRSGEAGIEIRRGALDAGLSYYVEKLPFPELRGSSRTDQFSSLRFRVGFKIGR